MSVTTLIAGLTLAIVNVPSASNATITTPTGNPYVVAGNASGQPQSFTVTASGFPATSPVFIEQCDGVATTDPSWDVTQKCQGSGTPSIVFSGAGGASTLAII
jgi:hypothetical protein